MEKYKKRTQRDYSYTFKLQVVKEVQSGELNLSQACKKYGVQARSTIRNWVDKFGTFDVEYVLKQKKMKTPEQKIMELEQKVKLLEKQKKSLEYQLEQTDKKALFFDMMIDIAEDELKIPIRKKSLSDQFENSKKSIKKQ